MKISDLVPRRSFRASELYRAVYGPMGVEFQMAVTLPSAPGTVVGIALNRDRRDFGERDRRVLQLLQPHLAQQQRDAADREATDATAGMLEPCWPTAARPRSRWDGATRSRRRARGRRR